jgi:REP element-mobilizing transposase RayT
MRKSRVIKENSIYHVVARANRREYILNSEEIKCDFLKVVARAKKKFRFKLTNFCIMGNHFHFMITPDQGESLSKIMQWILSVFAVRFNKRFGYSGHVWYDRFKSKILDGLQDFLHAFRYIAENPVRAGIVRRPWEHAYNGITFIRNKEYHIIEEPNQVLSFFEPTLCGPVLLSR